ncbi:hypothetical protein FRC02_006512 [Tulasnella sp. 418]|nr:hypothetical protein FRC02_006512 [Tulasnella sp. 418]
MIFQYITKKSDLCSLARSCSTFQLLAEPLIYHSFTPHSYINFLKAAKSIISCPRRHPLVRFLDLPAFTEPPQSAFHYSSIARIAAKLLTVVIRLKYLRIRGSYVPRWVLKHCYHPLLNNLNISMLENTDTDDPDMDQMCTLHYLARHPSITKLTFCIAETLPSLEWRTKYLPNLETLCFAGPDLHQMVKGRHFKRVCIDFRHTLDLHEMNRTMRYLSGMGSTLQVLDLSDAWLGPIAGWTSEFMQEFVGHLPLLRFFGLPWNEHDPYDDDEMVEILQSCSSNLVIFRLCHSGVPPTIPDLPLELFAARESLEWIIITSEFNDDIDNEAVTREYPSGGLNDKSELLSRLRDLGLGEEPWDEGVMNFQWLSR